MAEMKNHYSVGLDPNVIEPPPRLFRSTTVLTRAISSTASRQTRYLLEKGCDPNAAVSRRKLHPLMVACFVMDAKRRMTIFRCLVKHGADPTLRDVYGRNSVMYVCALGLRDETELLVKDCDYNLNATDLYGDTALHMCAKAGNAQVLGVVLREMLRYQMDIGVLNHTYLTPLCLAILNGNYECAKMLHQAGGCPRFLESKFSRLIWVLCNHRKQISSAGLKAVDDGRMVGRAFGARQNGSAGAMKENGIKTTLGDCGSSIVTTDGTVCNVSATSMEMLHFPQIFPVCMQEGKITVPV